MDRKALRHLFSALMVIGGALLLWLSPETLVGAVTLVAGLALEAIGIRLDHA